MKNVRKFQDPLLGPNSQNTYDKARFSIENDVQVNHLFYDHISKKE